MPKLYPYGPYLLGSVLILVIAAAAGQSVQATKATDPTTPHLDAIFLGRCYERNPKCDCPQLWRLFYNTTAYKDATTITRDAYQPLFDTAKSCWHLAENQTLLFSGSRNTDISEELSKNCQRLCTAADVLPGFALNKQQFCGSTAGSDFNYTTCPAGKFDAQQNKWFNARHAFWEAAHLEFAKQARGVVTILVHALSGTAYKRDSALARLQIPALEPKQVTEVNVYVVRNITLRTPEVCGSGSLILLDEDLKKLFPESRIHCMDNPIEVREYLCSMEPNSAECAVSSRDKDAFDDDEFSIFEIVSAGISSFIFGTLVSLVIVIAVARRRQELKARREQQQQRAGGILAPNASRTGSINAEGDHASDRLLLGSADYDSSDDSDD